MPSLDSALRIAIEYVLDQFASRGLAVTGLSFTPAWTELAAGFPWEHESLLEARAGGERLVVVLAPSLEQDGQYVPLLVTGRHHGALCLRPLPGAK